MTDPSRDDVVLGIDGGGTRTRAVLVDTGGHVLGVGIADGSNVHDVGPTVAGRQLRAAVERAWAVLGGARRRIASAGCCLAGLVTDADRTVAMAALAEAGLLTEGSQLVLDHDGAAAVAGAHLGRPGLVLIAGTGSACYGRAVDGSGLRVGGWGWWFGDEGSGAWLGREALVAVAEAADGRGRATALSASVLQHLECGDADDLLFRVYVRGLDRAGTASLAPLVFVAAAAHDPVASAIVERAADHLARVVETAVRAIATERPPLALVGGVATAAGMRAPLDRALERRGVDVDVVAAALAPPFGASLLALEHLGPITPETLDALCRTSRRWDDTL